MFCKKLEEVASNHLASFAGGSGYEFEADAKPFKNLSQGPSCQQYTQCHYGFFAEEKKPNPTLALHKSFFSVYEGTGFITNPEGTGFTTNSFTSNNPLGEGTSSIPGPNPQLSNTLPVTKPAYTMSAPKELGLCKPTLFHGDRKQISTFIQECKVRSRHMPRRPHSLLGAKKVATAKWKTETLPVISGQSSRSTS